MLRRTGSGDNQVKQQDRITQENPLLDDCLSRTICLKVHISGRMDLTLIFQARLLFRSVGKETVHHIEGQHDNHDTHVDSCSAPAEQKKHHDDLLIYTGDRSNSSVRVRDSLRRFLLFLRSLHILLNMIIKNTMTSRNKETSWDLRPNEDKYTLDVRRKRVINRCILERRASL